jgi:hypothetical protein
MNILLGWRQIINRDADIKITDSIFTFIVSYQRVSDVLIS